MDAILVRSRRKRMVQAQHMGTQITHIKQYESTF